MKLVGILGLEDYFDRLKSGEISKAEYDEKALYKTLPEDYKKKTFADVLKYMVKDETSLTAKRVNSYLEQDNGNNVFCEVKVYDESLAPKKDENGSSILRLEDKVTNFIDRREVDNNGTKVSYECLFMTISLYSDVGSK